jgi:hypothetical protein
MAARVGGEPRGVNGELSGGGRAAGLVRCFNCPGDGETSYDFRIES